jgi:hypothetical protein
MWNFWPKCSALSSKLNRRSLLSGAPAYGTRLNTVRAQASVYLPKCYKKQWEERKGWHVPRCRHRPRVICNFFLAVVCNASVAFFVKQHHILPEANNVVLAIKFLRRANFGKPRFSLRALQRATLLLVDVISYARIDLDLVFGPVSYAHPLVVSLVTCQLLRRINKFHEAACNEVARQLAMGRFYSE